MPALRRRDFLSLSAAGIAASVGFGARAQSGAAVSPPPKTPKGQVVIGLSQEPKSFNPLMPGVEVDEVVWTSVFSSLWMAAPDGTLVPDLAVAVPSEENGGITEGGLAWTVKLREGVVWHDGAPFTAEDV